MPKLKGGRIAVLCKYTLQPSALIGKHHKKVVLRMWEDATVTETRSTCVRIKYTRCGTNAWISNKHLSDYRIVRFPTKHPAINLEQIRLAFEFQQISSR